ARSSQSYLSLAVPQVHVEHRSPPDYAFALAGNEQVERLAVVQRLHSQQMKKALIREPLLQCRYVGWLQRCELHAYTTHDGGLLTSPRTRTFLTSQRAPCTACPSTAITSPGLAKTFDGVSKENDCQEELVVLCSPIESPPTLTRTVASDVPAESLRNSPVIR